MKPNTYQMTVNEPCTGRQRGQGYQMALNVLCFGAAPWVKTRGSTRGGGGQSLDEC